MDPRLVAIAGPLAGRVFAVKEAELSIGRSTSNDLCIEDARLSRRHCVIRREAASLKITDLDSRNSTFVGGVPIKERLLEHGDRISIGGSVFLFLLHEDPTGAKGIQFAEEDWVPDTTISLSPADARDSSTSRPLEATPTDDRTVRDLEALVKISAIVNVSSTLEDLERALLDSIFEVVPAERGTILLAGARPGEFNPILGRVRSGNQQNPIAISRTVVNRVLTERVALLANGLLEAAASERTESQEFGQLASVLCVPLGFRDDPRGVLYLDTCDPGARFNEKDLRLVTAVASVAALAVKNLQRVERLEDENDRLRADLAHEMVGESPPLREIEKAIAKVASTSSTVLIRGESGTGKELAARAIHRLSPRARGPFTAINCAALTEALLESELFGHEKGAFTGAIAQKKGKLEVTDGGTLFLDEVGELAPALQAKLLRVLQEQEFERVGGTRPIKVDVRLIAATNKDLEEAIRDRSFRQDLYYRLNVVSLRMPALRERREDIPLLASYFVREYSAKVKRNVMGLSAEARACLLAYDWPGNVRELANAIERAVVLGSTDVVLPEDLPETLLEAPPIAPSGGLGYHDAVREAKKQLILKALDEAGGSYVEAAKLLGMHANYLHRLVRNLDLRSGLKRDREGANHTR
jgi:Nif-specific regulatory protein